MKDRKIRLTYLVDGEEVRTEEYGFPEFNKTPAFSYEAASALVLYRLLKHAPEGTEFLFINRLYDGGVTFVYEGADKDRLLSEFQSLRRRLNSD